MKIMYQAEDGTLFETEQEARGHEEGAFSRWLNRTGLGAFLEWDGLDKEEHDLRSSDHLEAHRVLNFLRAWCKLHHFKIKLGALRNDG